MIAYVCWALLILAYVWTAFPPLFNEVQKAWKVSLTLQSDLKAENIMLAEKHKIEEDQNNDVRTQVAALL
nr:kinesin-like protein KIN-14B [Tanacetum cinerariifolium]